MQIVNGLPFGPWPPATFSRLCNHLKGLPPQPVQVTLSLTRNASTSEHTVSVATRQAELRGGGFDFPLHEVGLDLQIVESIECAPTSAGPSEALREARSLTSGVAREAVSAGEGERCHPVGLWDVWWDGRWAVPPQEARAPATEGTQEGDPAGKCLWSATVCV